LTVFTAIPAKAETAFQRSRSCERRLGDTRSHRPRRAMLRWHDCAVFKVREKRRSARTGRSGLSKLNSMDQREGWPQVRSTLGTGSSSRRAVCPAWPSPALQVLELP
jgi:hypothetical protein